MDKRIQIFVGPIGSGKTEISINYALSLHQKGENVALLDFDVVKPYIRIRDVAKAMEPLFTTKPEKDRSGMGFTFMEAFMDEVTVESQVGYGTVVHMKKTIGR